jgi:hypothetical protein
MGHKARKYDDKVVIEPARVIQERVPYPVQTAVALNAL